MTATATATAERKTSGNPCRTSMIVWVPELGARSLTCGERPSSIVGMIATMSLHLLYLIFLQILGLVLLTGRTSSSACQCGTGTRSTTGAGRSDCSRRSRTQHQPARARDEPGHIRKAAGPAAARRPE